jgi:predicted HTH transcriptional regulator
LVEVFDDRIEITNPGTPRVGLDRLLDEPAWSPNELMAHQMRLMGFCEERGSGIDRVIARVEAFSATSAYLREQEHRLRRKHVRPTRLQ